MFIENHSSIWYWRYARSEKQHHLWVLPWALRGHHLHHQDPAEDALLFLQPHRALSSDRLHGSLGLHSAPGLWGEIEFRWVGLAVFQHRTIFSTVCSPICRAIKNIFLSSENVKYTDKPHLKHELNLNGFFSEKWFARTSIFIPYKTGYKIKSN